MNINPGAKRLLIVNADDFGQSQGINLGIAKACRDGILTSATMMVNGEAFEEAVDIARQTPQLGVGIHLNLVEGKPIDCTASTLVNGQGELLGKWGLIRRHLTGKLSIDDIQREVRAQIQRALDAGLLPTHLDGHQHLHVYPPFAAAIAEVAVQMGVTAMRLPAEKWSWRDLQFAAGGIVRTAVINWATRLSRHTILQAGMRTTDRFRGTLLTGHVSAAWLNSWLPQLPVGVTELMVHPGLSDDDRLRSRLRTRKRELQALVDPQIAKIIAESSIKLIHYGNLNQLADALENHDDGAS